MTTTLPTGASGRTDGAGATGRFGTLGRRLLAAAALGLLGAGAAQAQLNYATTGFTNAAGTYTDLATTGSPIAMANTDDANSAATPIGFTFNFNGTAFTDFVMNTNGLVRLGTAAPSSAALYYTYSQSSTDAAGAPAGAVGSTNAADVNLLMPFNVDLISGTSAADYRVLTTGATGSRVCTIQWKNVADKSRATSLATATLIPQQYTNMAFQVRLFEGTNNVEFVYNTATPGTTTAFKYVDVGIKGNTGGTTNTVLTTKGSTQAWSLTTALAVYASATANRHNVRLAALPDAGRTYRFAPTPANDLSVAALYTLNKLPFPVGAPHVVRAAINNVGLLASAGGTATLTITGPVGNAFTATATIPALAIGAGTVVSFAGYTPAVNGSNTVTVSVAADDNAANNARTETQVANATDYSYIAPPGASVTSRGFGVSANVNSFASKFTASAALNVVGLRAQLSDPNTVGKTVYGILVNPTTGAIIARSPDFIVPAGNVVDGTLTTFTFPAPVTQAAGDFMVGVAQTYLAGQTVGYFPVAVQNDLPNRAGTFYTVTNITGPTPTAPADQGTAGNLRFMMEAITAPAPACAAVSSIAASAITTTSANVTFSAPGGAVDYTVTYTPAGGTASTVSPNPTASPVALSGLTPGTTYAVSIVSNCGGGLTSSAATGSFTTLPTTDAGVNALYTLGQLPIPFGTPHVASASVKNNGATATAVPATLTVTGPGGFTFSDTQTSASLAAGASATLTFAGYTPTAAGAYTVTVTTGLGGDQLAGNNAQSAAQTVNLTTFSYSPAGASAGSSVGFNTGSGILATKFTTTANRTVTAVRAFVAAGTVGNTVFGVLQSATGVILGRSNNLVVATAGLTTFTLQTPVTVPAGTFLVGLAQTANATTGYFPMGTLAEVPTRLGSFFTTALAGSTPNDVGASNLGVFVLEAVTTDPPACGSVSGLTLLNRTDNSVTIGFTAPVGSTVTNYTATLTQTVGGAVVGTQTVTASPVSFGGLTSGTGYTVSIVTNCPSGGVSTPTVGTFSALTNLVVTTVLTTPGASYNNVTIRNGGNLSLTGAAGGDLNVAGVLTIEDGGTFTTNVVNTLVGTGRLVALPGSTIRVNDAVGITNDGTGAFQIAGGLDFGTDANFIFGGNNVNQVAGPFFPGQVRSLTVNNGSTRTLFLDNPLAVRQLVRLQSGSLDPDLSTLTLLSVAGVGTAVVDNTGGVVLGSAVTMQRATDSNANGTTGYHHYSSPVAATTLADLDVPAGGPAGAFANTYNPAYNTALEPGRTRPFPTVFGYDETRLASSPAVGLDAFSKGWFSPAAATDAMTVGKGYSANIPNALVVDFTGALNNGPVNVTGLTRGTDTEAGWHLLGNPYPSPLNWDNVAPARRTGLDGFMYVANSTGPYSGTYRARQNGIGGSPLIVAGSGFFVRTAAGQTGSLNLTNADRETTFGAQPAFGRDARPQLTLTLANAAGTLADDAYVYLQAGATTGVDAAFDAPKLYNSTGLNLAAMAGTERLAISGLPLLTGSALVPLTVGVPAVGRYTLTLGRLANFGNANLVLRDNLTGARTPLVAGASYPFTVSAFSTAGRFVLELNPAAGPLASASAALATGASVYPNPTEGRFTLLLPPVAGADAVTATLLNALGQVVATRTIALTAAGATAEFNTAGLATGVYALKLTANGATATQRVVVK